VFFRSRRKVLARLGTFAVVLASYLFSLGPATASVIYCISDTGHSGFELVAAGQSGCASCCHDPVEGGAHDGLQAQAHECTDVALSLPQDVRRANGDVTASTPWPLPLLQQDEAAVTPVAVTGTRSQTVLSPPRSSPSMLVAFTVLTI
jgi:hypothetical protein